ncbi:MAG: ATP-binding protein, partial [Bacteroidales bacterium]|nr:ATP-binding protein [Bacteroidales bacterium]
METKKNAKQKMDMLSAVEEIVEFSKTSQFDAAFFKKLSKPLKYLSSQLDITKEQSLMMALFMDNSSDASICISDFAKQLKCSTIRIIRFMKDIDVLESKGLICGKRSNMGLSYRVPWDVIEAFKNNEKYTPKDYSNLSCDELFNRIGEIMVLREDEETTTALASNRIQELLEKNKHLVFVQKLKSFKLNKAEENLLVLFAHLFVNNSDDNVHYYDLEFFYDKKSEFRTLKAKLKFNIHPLQDAKLIEYVNNNGFADANSFCLTWAAKQTLFSELQLNMMSNDRQQFLRYEDIQKKQLFYDQEIANQISNLGQLLEGDYYHHICHQLKEKGFNSGFSCLFYGAPGTGKTETVLQLARQAGRDIMQVNISKIKSMWVGESEKNIKQIFDKYRSNVEKSDMTPILLFNEADAIIGMRKENASDAVDKMENAIQNIILQEMETLNGILIATTNLAQNMDRAFERRFLYKIKFNKPALKARMQIWQSMLPDLPEADIKILAEKYDFSGGQIENVARHYTIDSVLQGEKAVSLEKLISHCNNECL